MEDLVSIIIPVYNSEKFIKDTIYSINSQTYSNWEAIFVDDFSTDKSVQIITQHLNDKIRILQLDKNEGPANARNIGINAANGRYITFLDADDIWEKDKLQQQLTFMKDRKVAFSFTEYEFIQEDGDLTGKITNIPKQLTYHKALNNTTIFTSTVMLDTHQIPKELIQMPNVKSEDTATWWKILKNGYTAYGLRKRLSYYRISANSLSSNKIEAIKRIWNLYRNVENLGILPSAFHFVFYALHAVKRRL